ncbi:hypothetical protein SAMN05216439_1017 [Methanobrevibacter gottschalkii]|uniref:UPF0179 protein SAMN05216439_1017 n=1 Tax=Methanobrevibacter gottschalkii TaxID=190974 RepID=A0A1H7HEJ1_9EURY|nr:UPF0179 family protein [Methanobrevibacter gottschalkii]MCQ2971160.1 UPF0179 family protein [archaeon]SEK47842.1 hypothetical protein SAMN05216439_1017 [Methanobrevibacter gottschalkii]
MITLIGKDLAKEGQEFVFLGPADECENCRFKSSCVGNLELNRKYVVVNVKENEQKCPIHSGGLVIPVEIDRAQIDVLTASKNIFEGSTFTFNAPDCDEVCEFHDLCFPEGLQEDDKCLVLNNNGKHNGECKKGFKLNKLTLGFVI